MRHLLFMVLLCATALGTAAGQVCMTQNGTCIDVAESGLPNGTSVEMEGYVPQNGDIIFRQSARSYVERSIQDVTSSIGEYSFTHVGIVYIDPSGEVFVLEAVPPEVTVTRMDEFLHPSGVDTDDYISVAGRLKHEFRHLIPQAIAEGLLLTGKKYDYAYTAGNEEYYCSELIYEIFRRANGGMEVFVSNAMTFKSPETGETTDGWLKYFEKLGIPVPEGEAGTNPGAMSRSDAIDIIGVL